MAGYALTLSDAEIARYRRMAEGARQAEADLWAAAGIGEGAVVADIGCGPGAVSTLIGQLVGPEGQVWAVDQNPEALAAAEALATELGVGNLHTRQGEATATGLAPGTMDVVVMRHVLAHNGGREQPIVDHLASLVKPGGCVYLIDIEAMGMRVRPPASHLADLNQRYHDYQTARGNDMSVGLRLDELLRAAELEVVEHRGRIEIVPVVPGFRPPAWAARDLLVEAGAATPADLDRWAAAFEDLDRGEPPGLTLFVPLYCAIGRRPA